MRLNPLSEQQRNLAPAGSGARVWRTRGVQVSHEQEEAAGGQRRPQRGHCQGQEELSRRQPAPHLCLLLQDVWTADELAQLHRHRRLLAQVGNVLGQLQGQDLHRRL